MDWDTLASFATALGVAIAVWQFRESAKLTQSTFEDSLDQQYRELSMAIPVDALIGKEVPNERKDEVRELIYNYLDLSNEQVFLRKKNRVGKDTWNDWCAGIKSNLQKIAFKEVWDEIKSEAPSSFTFLEQLEKYGFASDPKHWP
ncbi:hypothetical protein ACFL2V_12145 [Pseudomonadota bacterium]